MVWGVQHPTPGSNPIPFGWNLLLCVVVRTEPTSHTVANEPMCSLPTQPTYRASLPFSLSQSDKTAANAAADHCLGGAAEAANRTHFSSCTTLAALFTAELLGFCLFSKSGPLDPYRCVKHRHPSSEYPAEVKLGRIIFYCLQTGIQTGLRHHVILALTFELPLVTAFFFFGKSHNSVQLFVTPWTVAPPQSPLSMEFSRQEHWIG